MNKRRSGNSDSLLLTYKQISEDSNLGINTVMRLAKESNSLVKIGRIARVNREKFYSYVLEKYSDNKEKNINE